MTDVAPIVARLREALNRSRGFPVFSVQAEDLTALLDALEGKTEPTIDREDAYKIADALLDRPSHDPDSDENVVARQLLRQRDHLHHWHRTCETIATILGLPEPEADFAEQVRAKFNALTPRADREAIARVIEDIARRWIY